MEYLAKYPGIERLKTGDTLLLPLSFQHGSSPQKGTVVYIHPELRFFTAEFSVGNGRIRESYCALGDWT